MQRPALGYPYGYIPLSGESLSQSLVDAAPPDPKEVFNVGPVDPPRQAFADEHEAWVYSPNLWPAALPELQDSWTAYYRVMARLCNRLMSLLARALDLPADFFADKLDRSPNALRAINYPARAVEPASG